MKNGRQFDVILSFYLIDLLTKAGDSIIEH